MKNRDFKENQVKLFQNKKIRTKWNSEIEEDYYFSVIDVVGVLSESKNPRKYWSVPKTRLNSEGVEVATICSQLKMPAKDGKLRKTDVANSKQLFRIIQSIPSPNAEPFKQWLAQVGSERINEIADPELAIERAIAT
ncbi:MULTISPECIES: Bro-N domain-containing protein [Methanobrevibacter]|uniref:BRO-N domain-containing protein n=1 Tax=Methanobrevibacter TaxID=2172 RepID=UPI000B0C1A8F|nr:MULTISPECIES: Bro-N domain-containing protein [Methanobrevibacter]